MGEHNRIFIKSSFKKTLNLLLAEIVLSSLRAKVSIYFSKVDLILQTNKI